MDANNIKRHALSLALGVLCGFVLWKGAVAVGTHYFATRTAPASPKAAQGPQAPAGAVLININMVGFDPATIEAKAGEPLKLAFYRPNDANCAREVIFPDLGIEKKLPPGETTIVDITPSKTGSLLFHCGMKMMKGNLIVR